MWVAVCAAAATAAAQNPRPAAASPSEMQKAAEEFVVVTRHLGLRADSPRRSSSGGSGAWHGRLFENFRNDFLDAIPHEIRQRGLERSTLRRNQFGFNVAGPLVLPKLPRAARNAFVSISYEGVREGISRSLVRTVPTLAERSGDFSATVDTAGVLLPIYDPASTARNPAFDPSQPVSAANLEYTRTPYPGNRIPAAALDAVAQRALGYYPSPNTAIGPFLQNNFFLQSLETNIANGVISKVDLSASERHRVTAGFSFSNGLQGSARWFDTAANPGPVDRTFNSRHGYLNHIFTASASTVHTAGIEVDSSSVRTGDEDAVDHASALGLPVEGSGRFPVFSLGRYLGMGQSTPASRTTDTSYTFSGTISTRRGRHNLRAAGALSLRQVNSLAPAYPSGRFTFSEGPTSLPGIINTGHEFATFLLGDVDYAQVGIVTSPSYFRRWTGRVSLSDTYQPVSNLTMSVSLNVENATPRVDKYDRQSTVDLSAINPATGTPGAMIVAGRGAPRAFQPTRYWTEPRASISWSPRGDSKTTVRGSYSRSYSPPPLHSGQWGTQAFNGSPNFYAANSQLQPAFRLSEGLPPLPRAYPDFRGDAVNNQTADLVERSGAISVYQRFDLTMQRELPGSVVLTWSLGDTAAKNVFIGERAGANLNALPLWALQFRDRLNDESFQRSLRPYPQFLGFDTNELWPRGRYRRDSSAMRLEKRASEGLVVSAEYELSRQMDDYSGPGVQDVYNASNEWAPTRWNSPERLSMSFSYALPIGSGKDLLAFNDWRRFIVDGWSFSAVSTYQSGRPLAIRPQFNNTGGVVPTLRVDVVPGVDPQVASPGPEGWFNPLAFAQPPDFTTGTAARTFSGLLSPGYQNHDLSVTKRFRLSTEQTVELTAVGLNFLNHANWNDPDTVIGPESAPNLNAGNILGSTGGRVVQLGLRFGF